MDALVLIRSSVLATKKAIYRWQESFYNMCIGMLCREGGDPV